MRLPPILPETLSPQLREVHDGIASLVTEKQSRIAILNDQGALIGPFPAMLHFPQFGIPALLLHRALSAEARLPKTVREVAILAVGAAFGARYEVYAHEITAAAVGLSPSQIATLAAGGRPDGLSDQEAIAFDVSRALVSGQTLHASTYARVTSLLGREGVGELAFLVGGYSLIAIILNCFDVPAPED
ncbi:MAG: carboxymuconolactone decarboxylase family protein [Acidobacteria bacterium]|nr:carboxymuconolactone decarboxylase family protein [Acidobacteriota bacterium]